MVVSPECTDDAAGAAAGALRWDVKLQSAVQSHHAVSPLSSEGKTFLAEWRFNDSRKITAGLGWRCQAERERSVVQCTGPSTQQHVQAKLPAPGRLAGSAGCVVVAEPLGAAHSSPVCAPPVDRPT